MAAALMGRRARRLFIILLIIIITTVLLTARGGAAQKGDGCGHSVLGPGSGSVASLGYPLWFPGNAVCEWEITVAPGNTLLLRIADLHIGQEVTTSSCQITYLRVYDGVGGHRREIVKFCGQAEQVPEVIRSRGNQVTVQFMSGTQHSGRGFFLSYSTNQHPDLISCLDRGDDFTEAEFSRFCPAGCLTDFGAISGTVPHGYRDSSMLCLAGIHAGVVSNTVGGQISVVSSKGTPHYESTLANNVTSTAGHLSPSLFTFKTSGCYGTLGLESGVVQGSQLSASSVWEWSHGNGPGDGPSNGESGVWGPSGARLKRAGFPWAAANSNGNQWLQIDLIREKRITGIATTGSALPEYQFYVSAYRVLYSHDGQKWSTYREADSAKDKIFQGNINYQQEVRNNFIPPITARLIRISPAQWHKRIALKLELLGCQPHAARPRTFPAPPAVAPPRLSTDTPTLELTTPTPNIRNNTMPPNHDVALVAVLVPVLVVVLTAPLLAMVCTCLWKNRKNTDVTYDLPHWDRTVWWKSMKQFLPSKQLDEESVRYSSSREAAHSQRLHTAEYAQPLVTSAVTSLGQRSTFRPEEGVDPEYDLPLTPDPYGHAYAEPLPSAGPEYATPILMDRPVGLSGSTLPFTGRGLLTRTDSGQSGRSPYDTPKHATPPPGQATPTEEELLYQVPQNCPQNAPGLS